MTRIWFTPRSARRTLEHIRPVVERMARVYREMEVERPRGDVGDTRVAPRYFENARTLLRVLEALARAGVRVVDPRRGWIDFPALRAGRPVLLSWQLGEPLLGYWRESDDARGPRLPLDEDGPWELPRRRAG